MHLVWLSSEPTLDWPTTCRSLCYTSALNAGHIAVQAVLPLPSTTSTILAYHICRQPEIICLYYRKIELVPILVTNLQPDGPQCDSDHPL